MTGVPVEKPKTLKGRLSNLWVRIVASKEKYILILPGIVWYVIFAYIPIFGLSLAFKKYVAKQGLFGSPWIGMYNFNKVFADPAFFASIVTTIRINAGRLLFVFPVPILFALMINEVRLGRAKKILQSIYTFPNFLSWVIVASIMISILGQRGLVNSLLGALFGAKPVPFLGKPSYFQPMVYLTDIWKTAGWSAIIYMASISGIDQEQYEAAEIDGASRIQRIVYITLPSIRSTIMVMFILAVGRLMSDGFDQIFNLSNSATIKGAETLDMYIYRITFKGRVDFAFSSAVALFRSTINMLLLIAADRVSKAVGGSGLIG